MVIYIFIALIVGMIAGAGISLYVLWKSYREAWNKAADIHNNYDKGFNDALKLFEEKNKNDG